MKLESYIEQTLLKPDTTPEQILKLCAEALDYNFLGVCVNSSFVPLVKSKLAGTAVKIVSVIGFPLGAASTESKSCETNWCVENGADEIDMVISIGQLKSKNYSYVEQDIKSVVVSAKGKPVKVIIETALLTKEEKMKACELSVSAGAQFVKTCTGFSGGGATVEDIALMKSVVGSRAKIKASGGIKNSTDAKKLIEAGATRLGTSSGVLLVSNSEVSGGY